MERIKGLNIYQKCILAVMVVMAVIFAVIYPKTIARVGYRYNDAILVPVEENGNTVYSGEIKGKKARFVVSDGKTVVFNYGDKTYGPYTVKEDAAAIPEDNEMNGYMTGIEVREGDEILFRGGVMEMDDFRWFYNEDGTMDGMLGVSVVTSDGIERDANGNIIDKMKPSVSTIYDLINDPELTHKGTAFAWFGAAFLCVFNAITIIFADELFRFKLAFRVRDPYDAEPSGLEIAGRYISCTIVAIIALVIFIMGLQ